MDALVKEVVTKIVREIGPRKIILFGSRAQGAARPDSDIDLVVIYDGPEPKREVKRRIHRLFGLRDFSMDLFVLSSEEYERHKHVANTLAREVAERGLVCHG